MFWMTESPGPDGLHYRVLKEPVDVITKPLTKILEKSWSRGEAPEDWRRVNVVPIFRKGIK